MKKLTEIQATQKKLDSEIARLEKKLASVQKQCNQLENKYPSALVCKKCGLAYSIREVGYKRYRTRKTEQRCLSMGEYDIWQDIFNQKLACCPKCGHNFSIPVSHDDFVSCTETYSRWEDKPDFKPCGTVCIDKTIRKLDRQQISYLKEYLESGE